VNRRGFFASGRAMLPPAAGHSVMVRFDLQPSHHPAVMVMGGRSVRTH
jgi:hypothetical protein